MNIFVEKREDKWFSVRHFNPRRLTTTKSFCALKPKSGQKNVDRLPFTAVTFENAVQCESGIEWESEPKCTLNHRNVCCLSRHASECDKCLDFFGSEFLIIFQFSFHLILYFFPLLSLSVYPSPSNAYPLHPSKPLEFLVSFL